MVQPCNVSNLWIMLWVTKCEGDGKDHSTNIGMCAIPCLRIRGLMTGLGVKVLLKHLASSSCLKMTGILFLVLRIRSNIRLALVVMMDKVSFIAAGSEGKAIRLVPMTHKNRLHNWRVLTRQSRSAYHLD